MQALAAFILNSTSQLTLANIRKHSSDWLHSCTKALYSFAMKNTIIWSVLWKAQSKCHVLRPLIVRRTPQCLCTALPSARLPHSILLHLGYPVTRCLRFTFCWIASQLSLLKKKDARSQVLFSCCPSQGVHPEEAVGGKGWAWLYNM